MALIEIDGLSVTFLQGDKRVQAVRDVSLSVAARESYGLVGESGSGKSTILRAICGLAPITAGSIRVGDALAPRRRDRAFARRVQMVFQDPYGSLHPKRTVDDTLSEPLAIHGVAGRDARVPQALSDVGLDPRFRFRYPHQLSGGQRQRVAIARALMLEPEILLLDEPTSALDASVQAEVLNLLSRLRSERGLTYLMVSHNLAVVDHMCDRLLVMKGGTAVEELDRAAISTQTARDPYTRALFEANAHEATFGAGDRDTVARPDLDQDRPSPRHLVPLSPGPGSSGGDAARLRGREIPRK